MGSNAGVRLVSDAGSSTGVATIILALLSAVTLAGISLVGVHQFAPSVSQRLGFGGPSAVRPPDGVIVTPPGTSASAAPKPEGSSGHHSAKAGGSSGATSLPVLLAVPATARRVADVASTAARPPRVVVPSVGPTTEPPSPSPSSRPTPTAVPPGSSYTPDVPQSHHSRRGAARTPSSYTGGRDGGQARSHRGSSGCGAPARHGHHDGDQRGNDGQQAYGGRGRGHDHGNYGQHRQGGDHRYGQSGDHRYGQGGDRGDGQGGYGGSHQGHHHH
jgi:hypothetical protein